MNLTDINEIHALLNKQGFRFSKSMGQNFLTASWVPEDIAAAAELDENTGVLEVGPGIGCLTRELSSRSGKVLSVELDEALRPILNQTLADCGNVELVFGDVLKLDIPAMVRDRLTGLRPVVCANLPYNVTSPLLTALISPGCFETLTVMLQREVARRICAPANTADYGAFGVFVQWHTLPELLFDVPPSCFVPQPKVTSSVIRLRRRETKPVSVMDEALMFRVIRAAFNQRRKTLVNALSAGFPEIPKGRLENIVVGCGFGNKIRGEALDIVGYAKIADQIFIIKGADL